jgi:hypothetical protein
MSAPEKTQGTTLEHHITPRRLMRGIDALLAIPIKQVEVEYEGEAAKQIDPNKPHIIAVAHKTGLDVPIIIKALGNTFDLAIADQSTHHSAKKEANMFYSLKAVGEDNFIPVSYVWEGDEKKPRFDPSDASPMLDAMSRGKSILIAAHNPDDHESITDMGTVKPGYSAALLGLLSGAEIIPVSVDTSAPDRLGRSSARVIVGEPYTLEPEPGIGGMQKISEKRQHGEQLSTREQLEFRRLAGVLRKNGRAVLDSVVRLSH